MIFRRRRQSVLSIGERVEKGSAWLDEHSPGWEHRIDILGLDMTNPCLCILGQLYDELSVDVNGYAFARNFFPTSDAYHQFVRDCGFFAAKAQYPELEQAWVELIFHKQNAAEALQEPTTNRVLINA